MWIEVETIYGIMMINTNQIKAVRAEAQNKCSINVGGEWYELDTSYSETRHLIINNQQGDDNGTNIKPRKI